MSESPAPDLQIVETRVYRGANVWSYDRSIHLVVDLGSLEEFPTNTLPGFTDELLRLLRISGADRVWPGWQAGRQLRGDRVAIRSGYDRENASKVVATEVTQVRASSTRISAAIPGDGAKRTPVGPLDRPAFPFAPARHSRSDADL